MSDRNPSVFLKRLREEEPTEKDQLEAIEQGYMCRRCFTLLDEQSDPAPLCPQCAAQPQ